MVSKLKMVPSLSLIVKIWICFTIIHVCSSYQHHNVVSRSSRSIKTTFDKEPKQSGGKVVAEIQNKISSLENSVKYLNDEIAAAESNNDHLSESLQEQAAMLEDLENEFASIENLLSNHTNLLDQIKHTVQPDPNEQAFFYSNETCGQVLNAQSGYVTFSRPSSQTLKSSCVWIIQANYHSLIKLTTKVPATYTGITPPRLDSYVIEILNEQSTYKTKVTKLLQGTKVTYSFKGPLIYVVLSFENNYDYYGPFEFHYESYGQRVQTNTQFYHKIYNNPIFEITQQLKSQDFYLGSNSPKKYASEFGSIVISNFTSKLHLLMNWNKEKCSANSFIGVIQINNLLDTSMNQSLLENLCDNSTESFSTNLLTTLGKSIVILIAKPFYSELPFNLTWTIATQYPSSYRHYGYGLSTNQYTCGSVLSGTSGVIYYKYSSNYRNGERCVWVILPQNPGDQIDLYFSHGSLTTSSEMPVYDYVYVMEINTTSTPPKLEQIKKFSEYTRNYTAISTPVYLLFYSDSAVTYSGFMINWKVRGRISDTVQNGISTKFNFLRETSGEMNIIPVKNDFYDTLYQIFVFVPSLPSTTRGGFETPNYVFGMNLEFNQMSVSTVNCIQENFTVFTLTDHYPLLREVNNSQCNGEGKVVLKNVDGIAILILKTIKDENRVNNSTMKFSWVQEVPENDTSVIKMENNRCGGVIIGKRGILRYKTSLTNDREGDLLNKHDHCLWLLQSPNSTTIKVKVLKDGSSSRDKYNYLFASTIDVNSGTLRNESLDLKSRRGSVGVNNEQVFNDSLLVISFHPNENSANGTGFLLQFWGNADSDQTGNDENELIEYRLRHSDAKSGRFLYESSSQHFHNPGKQLHVIAYSVTNPVHVATPQPIPTSVNWTMGVFKRDSGEILRKCVYDSISFYSTRLISGLMPSRLYNSYIWTRGATFPEETNSSSSSQHSCPNQIKVTSQQNILTTNNFAFLVIYKLVGSPVHSEDERKIDFVHKQVIPARQPARQELEKDDDDEDYFLPGYSSYPWSRGYSASQREVLRRVLQYRNRYHHLGGIG